MRFELKQFVEHATNSQIISLAPVGCGGNNQIYKIECTNGQSYALKEYLDSSLCVEYSRLSRESLSIKCLKELGETQTPALVKTDHQLNLALYTWIVGQKIENVAQSDLEQVLQFIQRLKQYSQQISATDLPLAADHCLSAAGLIEQIYKRIGMIQNSLPSLDVDEAIKDKLCELLSTKFKPLISMLTNNLKHVYAGIGVDIHAEIAENERILCPGDFGFHNIIKYEQSLYFIDFEYFGWDDPIMLISHFYWQPQICLTSVQKKYFLSQTKEIFYTKSSFTARLDVMLPLAGVLWALIVLNEFIPEKLEKKLKLGIVTQENKNLVCAAKLKKAQNYLHEIVNLNTSIKIDLENAIERI